MTTATVTRIHDSGALADHRGTGIMGKTNVGYQMKAVPAAADQAHAMIALFLAETVVMSVREWGNPDHVIVEATGDATTMSDLLAGVAAYLLPERRYFVRIDCDGDEVRATLAVQRVTTAVAASDRLLLTLSAYDSQSMIWVHAVNTDDLEG